tara:strand:- start:605 stop:2233 length:1629 start_codon:yes stop_codon:yes gene_type:complete
MAKKEVLELEVKSNVGEVADQTERLAGATKKGGQGFKGLGKTIKGVGMALKAAGIGLIVALLAKLMDVFKNNQKVLDGFNVAMETLNIAFNDLFTFISENIGAVTENFKAIFEDPQKSIKEFGDMIKNNLVERFNSLIDTFGLVGKSLKALFSGNFKEAAEFAKEAGKEMVDVATGVDGSFDKITETVISAGNAISDYTKKTIGQAQALVAANKAAELAAVTNAKLNAEYLKEAESLRQIRDNVNLTFAKRIKANDDLNAVLKKQQKLQKEALQTEVDALQLAYDINGNDANSLALKTKQVEMLQLEEAINGQLSEQKTNAIALENELRDAINATVLAGMEGRELELEQLRLDYEEKIRLADQAGQDISKIEAKYKKEQDAIIKKDNKQQVKWSEMTADQQLGVASNTAGNMAKIMGEESAAGKAFAVTQATIDTYRSATASYAALAGLGPAGPALGAIAAAAAVVAGLANVKAILAAGGGGGGGGGGASPSAPSPPAPQMMSGAFELGGGIEPEPTRAYVLTDEMSSSQNQLANIRRRATI